MVCEIIRRRRHFSPHTRGDDTRRDHTKAHEKLNVIAHMYSTSAESGTLPPIYSWLPLLKGCLHPPTCIAYVYRMHVRNTRCNYVYTCVHVLRTGIAHMYAIPVRNSCLQYVHTCVHVSAYMYAMRYMYALRVRTCKHRIKR